MCFFQEMNRCPGPHCFNTNVPNDLFVIKMISATNKCLVDITISVCHESFEMVGGSCLYFSVSDKNRADSISNCRSFDPVSR